MPQPIADTAAKLESLLKLRSIPFGMKLFERRADMEAIPKIRRPNRCTRSTRWWRRPSRLGWTVGITAEDLVGAQCRAVVGLGRAKDDAWRSGKHMTGVWFSTLEDAAAHQAAMHCVEDGKYEALAVAPLASGRLDPPDIALFYATPGAMMYFINGLQWSGYKSFDWGVVGESACADSWGRALKTRQPSLSIPCFAERRYGGVLDDEMLMALPPSIWKRRSPAWRRWRRTASAIRSRNTASSTTCATAWRAAIRSGRPRRRGEAAWCETRALLRPPMALVRFSTVGIEPRLTRLVLPEAAVTFQRDLDSPGPLLSDAYGQRNLRMGQSLPFALDA